MVSSLKLFFRRQLAVDSSTPTAEIIPNVSGGGLIMRSCSNLHGPLSAEVPIVGVYPVNAAHFIVIKRRQLGGMSLISIFNQLAFILPGALALLTHREH